jgi:hypothetical protein
MENRTGGTVPPDFEKWYAGAQMFNVFNGNLLLRNELSSLADMITKQISNRKAVKRSTPSDGKMAGLGPTVWVTGNAVNRQHRNWKNTDMQQELLTDAEETIEAWISVCTLSNNLTVGRSWRYFSQTWSANGVSTPWANNVVMQCRRVYMDVLSQGMPQAAMPQALTAM